ncbi:MAG: helix-turn-helix domain-containing protein [Clostridia bacterium]|nr:helix-turn-helix domain-containing protein [Clostridia bacterium]
MDQIKIGKFIAERRKSVNLTQMQLAEKLSITDRAVSKWETGKSLPDSSIMLELCEILSINVNDLLSGEVVTMENYNKEAENKLIEMVKQKEMTDRRMLTLEVFIGITATVTLFVMLAIAIFVQMEDFVKFTLIGIGFVLFIIGCLFALRIEQIAGYYECPKCGHRYVPTYKAVNIAPHLGRKRRMRCPKCNEKSWQKKVISKE